MLYTIIILLILSHTYTNTSVCIHIHIRYVPIHSLTHTHIHSYREALAAEKAKEDYMKRHMAGETEQARLDLARLAIVSPPISYSIITLV